MASRRKERDAALAERERRTRRLWQLGAALVTAAAIVIVAVVVGGAGEDKVPGPAIFAGIPQHDIALGSPRAPVTMTEFADLQCPFCRRYTAKVLPALVRRYVRPGKVRMVFRDIASLGDDSITAGRAAAAAGAQNRLWQFADVFYAQQRDENSGYVTDGFIRGVAGRVPGLDVGRLMSERRAPATRRAIDEARAAGHAAGVKITPSFFLQRRGGSSKPIEFSDYSPGEFERAIDSALAG